MSDLQGGLVVLGVLAVALVAIYNLWQVRQFQRRSGKVPSAPDADPLMQGEARGSQVQPAPDEADLDGRPAHDPDERREPTLGDPGPGTWTDAPENQGDGAGADLAHAGVAADRGERGRERGRERPAPDSAATAALDGPPGLWFPIVLRLPPHLDAASLSDVPGQVGSTRVCEWVGRDASSGTAAPDAGAAMVDHVLRLQAVDPRGPASAPELSAAVAQAQAAASRLGGRAIALDPAEAADAAYALHEFCSSVDVAIGLNVAAASGGFSGTKLRGLIEAAGFRSMPDQTYVLNDEAGNTLCTLTNGDGAGLDPQALRSQSVRAVSLQLDVPRTPGTLAQFERTAMIARQFAQALSGTVVDDAGRALDEASIARIRTQLASMVKAMRSRGIEPGDALTRRIFG